MKFIRKPLLLLIPLALIAAACSDDDTSTDDAEMQEESETDDPPTSPASLTAEEQTSDGTTIVVASITLPAPGFIAVHGDGGGTPGPVIGASEVLPAGESTNVTITLDVALTETGVVFPMAHIDINDNGIYEFYPPDETIDGPGLTAEGDVAVVPVTIVFG